MNVPRPAGAITANRRDALRGEAQLTPYAGTTSREKPHVLENALRRVIGAACATTAPRGCPGSHPEQAFREADAYPDQLCLRKAVT